MWHRHRTLFLALLVLTAARLVMAAALELSPDEAYYRMWARYLDWSYYSKGPGVAAAMAASTALFGDTAFGVRFWSPLLGLGTSLLIYRLARGVFDSQAAAWSVVILNVTPIFNAGSVVMTIDPPSVFLWTASLVAIWTALRRASPASWWWVAAGLLTGLGFLFKYTNAVLLLGLVLLPLASRWRRLPFTPGPWMLLGSFLVMTLPVVLWNRAHGWITVTHLIERGKLDEATGWHLGEFLTYLGLHAGVYSPLIFIGLLWALVHGVRLARRDSAVFFLMVFSLPLVVFYFLLSGKEAGEPNWTAPGMVGAGILLAHFFRLLRWPASLKGGLRFAAVGLGVLLSVLSVNFDLLRQAGAPIPYARDPLLRLKGWKTTAEAVDATVRRHAAEERPFLIAPRYQLAAILSHYLPEDCPVFAPPPHPRAHMAEASVIRNQFSFWPRYDGTTPEATPTSPFLGRSALYVTEDADREGVPPEIRHAFREVRPVALWDIRRMGLPIRSLKIFACHGYRGLDW